MRKGFIAAAGVVFVSSLAACTPATDQSGAGAKETQQSAQSQSKTPFAQSGNAQEQLPLWEVAGVPFKIGAKSADTQHLALIDAAKSVPEGQLHSLEQTGTTAIGSNGLPGPSLRAVIDNNSILAGLLTPDLTADQITDLAQVPTVLGTVNAQGNFKEDQTLTKDVSLLSGSNPENLYFEPQDVSVNGSWVVWREGSAGQSGAMPTIATDDWRLIVWNRQQNTVQEYASAYLLHGDRFAPRIAWSGPPTTDGTDLYFNAAMPADKIPANLRPADSSDWVPALLKTPLSDPGTTEVVDVSSASAASPKGGVYWVKNHDVFFGDEKIFTIPDEGWQVSTLVATSDWLYASVTATEAGTQNAWILCWNVQTGRLETAIQSVSSWAEMAAAGRFLTWGNGTYDSDPSMFLWAVGDDQPTILGQTQGMSKPLIGDQTLAVPTISDEGGIVWQIDRVS